MEKNTDKLTMTDEEKYGVQAVIFLQALAGIDEPEDVALRNWRNFQDWEKTQTISVYKLLLVE